MMSREHIKFHPGNLTQSRASSLSDRAVTRVLMILSKIPSPLFQQRRLYLISSPLWLIALGWKGITVQWACTRLDWSSPTNLLTTIVQLMPEKWRDEQRVLLL